MIRTGVNYVRSRANRTSPSIHSSVAPKNDPTTKPSDKTDLDKRQPAPYLPDPLRRNSVALRLSWFRRSSPVEPVDTRVEVRHVLSLLDLRIADCLCRV